MATGASNSEYQYFFRDDILKGQKALVTGGGSGIGYTIAEVFMRHGADVCICGRNFGKLHTAAAQLESVTSRTCVPLQIDVRKPTDIEEGLDKLKSKFERLDIVINCAAGNFLSPASQTTYNGFRTVLEIDALGTFNVTKAAYDRFFKFQNGGVVVNISATLQYRGQMLQAHAGAAKAAVDALTRHLAVEWGNENIRVNGIAPGPVANTEGLDRLSGGASLDYIARTVPLQRLGRKEDIADAALFLAGPAASYITGHILVVDGGSWMTNDNSGPAFERIMADSKL